MLLKNISQIAGILSCLFSLLALIGIGISYRILKNINKQKNEPKIMQVGDNNTIKDVVLKNKFKQNQK